MKIQPLVLTNPAPTPSYFLLKASLALTFLVGTGLFTAYASDGEIGHTFLIVAAVIGAYMAMNIGANDVANNVGPAVGSGAMTLTAAVVIAAICEIAGALVAGGEVTGTIQKGIIDPQQVPDAQTFEWLMMAALLAGALWLNLATAMGAPVSTTHSVVGGVLGAGVAAGGWQIANWNVLTAIAASWIISPVMGGAIAAFFLYLLKKLVMYPQDMVSAARRVVPCIIALMAWAFLTYLLLKGVTKLIRVDFLTANLIGFCAAAIVLFVSRRSVDRLASDLANDRSGVNGLFTWPLIFAAALLSFAHGANDVANAIGPLAAINDALASGGVSESTRIPLWIMVVGAAGIAVGLTLYGPRLIRTVGSEITELDKTRAFCIALSAAITVIVASQLGLPVSSTHIALGGVFGVGFLREYLKTSYASKLHMILENHPGEDKPSIQAFLDDFKLASVEDMKALLQKAKLNRTEVPLTKQDRKHLKKIYKHELVKRHHLYKIGAAWIMYMPLKTRHYLPQVVFSQFYC
jgi:PiT family inorganic phosphate transporter